MYNSITVFANKKESDSIELKFNSYSDMCKKESELLKDGYFRNDMLNGPGKGYFSINNTWNTITLIKNR